MTATSESTITLYFNDDNLFARASLKAEVNTEDGTSPTVVTKEMTAKELLDMSEIDATKYGIQTSPDGSISATKEQVLKALNESDDDITCISSSAM